MRSLLLSAAAAATLALMAPAMAHAQAASKTPCDIPDPVATGPNAEAQARANIAADHPTCAQAPAGAVISGAATIVDTAPAAVDASATVESAPPTVTTTDAAPASPTYTNVLLTNGPVPDTPENRAKYGQPLSRAGKMTKASGN